MAETLYLSLANYFNLTLFMGIAEKKPDTLSSVHGEWAEKYRQDIKVLLQGALPQGWKWVASSTDAVVATTTAAPFVFYKEFLPRNPFEKIKSLVRGSRCQRARQQNGILQDAGLGSPAVLCWGRGRKNDFLVTAGFAGIGFFQFLQNNFGRELDRHQLQKKRRLLQEAGTLIGRLHKKGISHGDLRQDNLLVREGKESFDFCFIDNESNRTWQQVPVAKIIVNLIQFSICSGNVLSRCDLLRLFNAYSQVYPRFEDQERRPLFASVMKRSKQRIIYYHVKKNLMDAGRIKSAQGTGWYDKKTALGRQIEAGVNLGHWFKQGEFYKDDKNIQVKKLACPDGMVVAKRFLGRGLSSLFKAWFGLERAPRLWKMSHLFMAIGIPIAKPLGYLLAGRGVWRRESYFFSEFASGMRDLLTIAKEHPERITRFCEEKFFSDIAAYLARLHNHGYCHGDTKWANVMVAEKSNDLLFIDLDGAREVKDPMGRAILKDVSRFIVDMLEQGLDADEVRKFAKEYSNMRVLDGVSVQRKIIPHIQKALVRHGRQDIDALRIWNE